MIKNLNLKKCANFLDWYKDEVARTTKDPKILTDILRRGNDDSVSQNAAYNPNCPPEILAEVLKRGKEDFVSCYAALNPNCTPEILSEVLKRGNNDIVSCSAALNPNCTPEISAEVLRRGNNDDVSWNVAKNPSCPPEMLSEVLRRGNNDSVSFYAAQNPNCPPEAKIKWMYAIGKIEKEDESKGHIIEYEDKKEDNLSDLKKLMGKTFNLKKYAQNEELYTEKVAKTTTDPQTLTNILRRGNNDDVSWYAAYNSNCPKEILIEILKRGKDDDVSQNAARNPNCSKEILAEVLKRGNNDDVSFFAALNPNCPPEILAEVLKRGNNDDVSRNAARNLNCPPEAKIKWMYAIGKIEKEDESKGHIIEYEDKKEDDLSDLKKLMGKTFNLKKYANFLDWYKEEVARTTKDPKVLTDIIRMGNDDWISRTAVFNPNCPSEMLAEVLKRGENNWISYDAASHKNCPPEMLAEILKRGNNDSVSQRAAQSPNCPSEALVEVLKRGKDDNVSQDAAFNPNCPPEAKINWMYTTGRIEKEDPNKHIIEYEDKKEDDLSDLKKLISKKSGWYKVAVADGEFRDLKNKVEKIKDDIRDFKKENKELNDKLKKIEKIIEDLNIGNRQFWQTQNIFTSLQRKIEKFEVITQEWAKFKKEIDKDIRNIIEKKTKAQVK